MPARNLGKSQFGYTVTAALALTTGALAMVSRRQRRLDELRLRIEQLERAGSRHLQLVQQQQLQFSLLSKAIDDPDLAAVLSTVDDVTPLRRRQFLFANAIYTNALLAYRIGTVSLEELHGHLRVVCQNPIFREYWEATRPHRASLPDSSNEARVGRMVDELFRDLDEADTDEWWVVGEAPHD